MAIAYGGRAAVGSTGQNFLYRSSRVFFYLPRNALCALLRIPYAERRQEVYLPPHLAVLAQRSAVGESAIRVKKRYLSAT